MKKFNKIYLEFLKRELMGLNVSCGSAPREVLIHKGKQVFSKTSEFTSEMWESHGGSLELVVELFHDWSSFRSEIISHKDSITMIGYRRLENLDFCLESIASDNVLGDLVEAGVWRGGASIYMKALLNHHNLKEKTLWLADSFEGVPPPNPDLYPLDSGLFYCDSDYLSVSEEDVVSNFQKYGLLDSRVKILKGWFKDTLPLCPADSLSLIRLDGDLYESTWDGLVNLYPKLSDGGYIIIDDYNCIDACRQCVIDYRNLHNIHEPIVEIDWSGVYWRKGV